jgi:hypothetical protein
MLKIPTQSITLIALLASTAFNVVQAVYLKRTQPDLLKKHDIVQGEFMQSLPCLNTAGQPNHRDLSRGGRKTVLYWFKPDCYWCDKNGANTLALQQQASGLYDFIPVATGERGPALAFLEKHMLDTSAFCQIEVDLDLARQFGAAPKPILLSNEGEVLHAWRGSDSNSIKQSIEQNLNIQLPEIVERPPQRKK